MQPRPLPSAYSRRRFIGLTGGAAMAGLLAACGSGTDGAAPAAAPTATAAPGATPAGGVSTAAAQGLSFDGETISMSVYSRNHASSMLYWERFAPPGLDVDVQVFTNPSDMNRAMETGDLDFALMSVFSTLIEAEEGFTSKIVSMISRRGMDLIVSPEAGISSIEDLAGKRIAVPPPGAQVLVLTSLLREVGIDLETDCEPVPVGFADHATALAGGDVDAFMGTEPICATSVADGLGVRVVDPYTSPLGDFNTALWASPSMQERPDLMTAAIAMQKDATNLLTPGGVNNREVWRDLLVDQFEYSEAVYEEVLDNIGAEWDFDEQRKSQVEAAGAAMLEAGILTRQPDWDFLYLLEHNEALRDA